MSRAEGLSFLLLTAVCATGCVRKGAALEARSVSRGESSEASSAAGAGAIEPTEEPSAVFVADGEPFCFAGTNNYYLSFKPREMVDDVLRQARAMRLSVMRTWGFIDRGSLDGSVPNVDGEGHKDGVYFQYWDAKAGEPAFNDGEDGLERLDYTLAKAREEGLRVVVVLTNNWKDFGGMNQYLEWFGLERHHDFYTDPRAKQAYKAWASHLIGRVNTLTGVVYRDDPTIFAWELANEPRCRNHGRYDRPQECTTGTITSWAREMSDYIKSLDPNHLVAVGDEGFFARQSGPGEQYTGADGVDHEALLALPAIDFGTFHLYPDHWRVDVSWGNQWIEDHIQAARAVGKPTVLEEYGIAVERNDAGEVTSGFERRRLAYSQWNELMSKRGGAGSMFWILVGEDPDSELGLYKDYDGFSVYNTGTDRTAPLLGAVAEQFPTQARACELARARGVSARPSPFVTVSSPPRAVAHRDVRTLLARHGAPRAGLARRASMP